MPRPLVLFLGDSLTEYGSDPQLDGWISLLLQRWNRVADIAQRGMAGYNTQMFMKLVVPVLRHDLSTTLKPRFITLWLGANDAALRNGPAGEQHVPLKQYKANLRAITKMLKAKAPDADLLLITPPPVDEDVRWQFSGRRLDRSNAAAQDYAAACIKVADKAGVPVLDLYTHMMATPQWQTLLLDGLHLTNAGNKLVETLLIDAIKTNFSTFQAELEDVEFPMWIPTGEDEDDMKPGRVAPPRRQALAFDARPLRLEGSETEADTNDFMFLSTLLVGFVVVALVAWRTVRVRRSRTVQENEYRLLTKG